MRLPGGADVNMSMLVADVRAFAKLAPDFKYTHVEVRDEDGTLGSTCVYDADKYNPLGCIVGAALREQGVVPGPDICHEHAHVDICAARRAIVKRGPVLVSVIHRCAFLASCLCFGRCR